MDDLGSGAGTSRVAADGLDNVSWMGLRLGSSFFYFFNRGGQLVRLGK